jgi:hypothetical protein
LQIKQQNGWNKKFFIFYFLSSQASKWLK